MIGLDTNVLIRYIVQDDELQARLASDLIENQCATENPAFINEITLCEIVWVLKRAYRYDKTAILFWIPAIPVGMTCFKILDFVPLILSLTTNGKLSLSHKVRNTTLI